MALPWLAQQVGRGEPLQAMADPLTEPLRSQPFSSVGAAALLVPVVLVVLGALAGKQTSANQTTTDRLAAVVPAAVLAAGDSRLARRELVRLAELL